MAESLVFYSENQQPGATRPMHGGEVPPLPPLDRLREGDEDAWVEAQSILWACAKAAARAACPVLSNEEIDDVAGSAMAGLLKYVDRIEHEDELRPLLARISRNEAISLWRRKRVRPWTDSSRTQEWNEDVDSARKETNWSDSLSPSDLAELTALLNEALNLVDDPDARLFLVENVILGISQSELSRKHGKPQGTVASSIRRGLLQISGRLRARPKLLNALRDFLR